MMQWIRRWWLRLHGVKVQGGGRIGRRCKVGRGTTLKWGATLTDYTVIGPRAFIGPYAVVLGAGYEGVRTRATHIGANVRIGAHALVTNGAWICGDALVGAGAFVRDDIMVPGTYVGIPARRIK